MNSVGVSSSAKPPTGKMKARAPPPPPPAAPRPAPRRNFPPTLPLSQEDGDRSSGDQKENVLRDSLDVLLTLPGGIQKRTTVSGSKALMDLLVELCSQYHLSPVHHTLELQTRDAQPLAFKPNTLLGMLDVHTVLIKERVAEEKPKRPPPKLPEKTVRLVVNYHKTQKAVVRVSPVVPLNNLIPIICEKCEFDPRHIVLLSDSSSSKGLDLSKSLSDLGIRELYVLDHSLVLRSKIHSAPILNFSDPSRTSSVSTSVSDKKGLLGFFKLRRKSKTEEPRPMEMDAFDGSRYAPTTGADDEGNYTAPNTPGINSRECTIAACHSMGNISRLSPKSELKKRRAPPPPPPGSASMQNFQSVSLDDIQIIHDSPNINQQKKRRAPPPPPPTAPGSSGPTEETPLDRSRLMEVVESPCSDKEVPPESSPTQGGEEPSDVKRELTEEDAKCEANNKTAEEAENKRHSTMAYCCAPVSFRVTRL